MESNTNCLEVWKPIKEYEDLYWVSNLGRILSLKSRKIMKPKKNNKGYLRIYFRKNGKSFQSLVHRLVLSTFNPVDNMDELQVDHKNRNREDNRLSNLRWSTPREQHYFDDQDFNTHSKKVYQYDEQDNFIKEWNSTREIEFELGYLHSCISKCCNGKLKSAYKFIWTYEKRES